MNISQKQTILTEIDAMLSFDFDQMIISQFPEDTEYSSIMFGKYNVVEFKNYFYKAINQLKNELESGLGLLLPNQENFNNDYGAVNLDSDMQNLKSYVSNINSRNDAAAILERVIYYQIRQGFWDKSQIKFHDVDTEKIKTAQVYLELVQKSLTANLKSFNNLKTQYETKIAEAETLLTTKKQELETIAGLLTTATSSNTAITELAANSKQKDTEIDGLLKNIKDKVKVVADNIEDYQTDFTTIQTDTTELKTQLETAIKKALEDLETSRIGIEFITSNRQEIIRLTGMAADGSLGSKFDQRQVKLEKGLTFWKAAVPIMTFLACIWVVVVFTCLSANFANEWMNILINMIKTTPAFILLGFVFSQYKKERNLEEEYAFKSAVAMTLTAYSTLLDNQDKDANKSRQEMLLKSIQQVHAQPRIHPESSDKIYSLNSKHLKEAIQTLSEAVKNIKS
jgi:hypothetical protein